MDSAADGHLMTRKTLLIVEDNSIEREGLAAVLRQAGYSVIAAANGKEALHLLNGGPNPSVVLLDMMMSEVDGWQLLKMLRSRPELLHLPVIIVTGLGIANLEWAKSLGAVGLVTKPIDVGQLKDALARVFGSSTDLLPA
jgi:putative two-component system response regulator